MNYESYSQEELLVNESFIEWVKNPTPENSKFWGEWLARYPHKQETVEQARAILLSLSFQSEVLSPERLSAMQASINSRIEHAATPLKITRPKVPARPAIPIRRVFSTNKFLAAASLTGILLLAALSIFYLSASDKLYYTTAFGETKDVTLPDNSLVTLNANSTMRFAQNISTGDREVWLQGEAYFHVNRQQVAQAGNQKVASRFIVHTSQMDVVVLGTRFNVNNRRGETKVVLQSGKVLLAIQNEHVAEKDQQILMKPGEMVSLATNQKHITRKVVDPQEYIVWKQNLIVLDETPLLEIMQILEDNYGVKVVLKNKELGQVTFSGTFPSDDLDVLLQTISKSVTIETVDNTLLIK